MHDLRSGRTTGCTIALLVLLAGCGGNKEAVNVATAPDQKVQVDMKASNFAFDPAIINAQKGQTFVLNVTNVTGEPHNITVKDPAGKVITDEDIPAHKAITVEVPLPTTGTYPLYCDKPLHATLGMKGRIEVK
jgi:plastocyanin